MRFGSFVTLRHLNLGVLAWSKPIEDTHMIDGLEGVIHYTIKVVAGCEFLGPKDKILSSSAIRQKIIEELALANANDFRSPPGRLNSEAPLELRNGTD